jgi:hypothetical protein
MTVGNYSSSVSAADGAERCENDEMGKVWRERERERVIERRGAFNDV